MKLSRHFLSIALIATFASDALAQQYTWSTLAGQPGGWGSANGTGGAARFFNPSGAAVDANGNVFVADTDNHSIRRITPAGVVTSLAGNPVFPGSIDGTGISASFNGPRGVAVDPAGNVFVADTLNHTIRRITPAGVVTTFAGRAGTFGTTDGTGGAARFRNPYGVATDAAGNVFVADRNNQTIRRITPAGEVTTLAGTASALGSADGTGSEARFRSPSGIASDAAGNLFVADFGNSTIRRITPAGVVTTLAGSPGVTGSDDGSGAAARFNLPQSIAVDGTGNALVADTNSMTIRRITPAGVVTTLAGSVGVAGSADGAGSTARFNVPRGVAADAAGNAFVTDTFNHTIRRITASGAVTTLAGMAGGASGSADGTGAAARFFEPFGVCTSLSGDLFVSDTSNQTIRRVTPSGVVTTFAGTAGFSGAGDATGTQATFYSPYSVASDAAGNLFVADYSNSAIRRITPAAVVTTLAGLPNNGGSADGTGSAARFNLPRGVATDAAGNVFVADSDNNHTIRRITPAGVVTTLAGQAGSPGSADGTGAAARFSFPHGVAVDSVGNVFVADVGNHTIRKVTPAGVVTTFAGQPGTPGSDDGVGSAARFQNPTGVAVDASGNVFVADFRNHTIRKITPAGVVTTIGGAPGQESGFDGVGSTSRFRRPVGIAVDANGSVFVVDAENRVVRGVSEAAASSQLINVSTRLRTGTGDDVLIAGFVVQGSGEKKVVIRALGPSLAGAGVSGTLGDPTLSVFNAAGAVVGANDNCLQLSGADQTALYGFGLMPTRGEESALVLSLPPGGYTAIVRGAAGATGNCLVEVYDADLPAAAKLINLSTRGPVGTGDSVMIAGFVVNGNAPKRVLVRALGPSLAVAGVPNLLADPTLELFSSTASLATNDDWQATQSNEISATGVAPTNAKESAIVATLPPGTYTAIVRGAAGTTGNALVEVYELP